MGSPETLVLYGERSLTAVRVILSRLLREQLRRREEGWQ